MSQDPNPSDDPTTTFRPGGGDPVSLNKPEQSPQNNPPQQYDPTRYSPAPYDQNQYNPGQYGQPSYGQQPSYEQPPAYGQPPAQPYPSQGYDPSGYGQQQPYPAAGYGQPPGYGYPPAAAPTNTMAILALIFAFVFAPLGIVFGFIARGQIKRTGESGEGLALAGLIVGGVFTLLIVAYIIFVFVILAAVAGSVPNFPN